MKCNKVLVGLCTILVILLFLILFFGNPWSCNKPVDTKSVPPVEKQLNPPPDQSGVIDSLKKDIKNLQDGNKKQKPNVIIIKVPTPPAPPVDNRNTYVPPVSNDNSAVGNTSTLPNDNSVPPINNDQYNIPENCVTVTLPVGCVQYWGTGTEWAHLNTNGRTTVTVPVRIGENSFNGLMSDGSYLDQQSIVVRYKDGSSVTKKIKVTKWLGEPVKNFVFNFNGTSVSLGK